MIETSSNFKEESLGLLKDISKDIINGSVDDLIVMYGHPEITESKMSFLTSNPASALVKLLGAAEAISEVVSLALAEDDCVTYQEVVTQKLESISHIIKH
ncbi:TPA: hypothetical protein VCH52_001697 [Streptococcus pyogenes]|nr:hypothetical protein [Streptococcus pyogenes]